MTLRGRAEPVRSADDRPPPGERRRRPPLHGAPPWPRAAPLAAARAGQRDGCRGPARLAPVRPARGRRPESRPGPARPDRGLSAGVDRCTAVPRSGPVRDLQQGPEPRAHGRAALLPGRLGSKLPAPRRRLVRRARPARRRAARPDSGEWRAVVDRCRAAGGDRLVLAADQPGPGAPGGTGRGRRPGLSRRAGNRRYYDLVERLFPPSCWPTAATSTTSSGTSSCPAFAPTACSAGRARPRSGWAWARRSPGPGDPPWQSRRACAPSWSSGATWLRSRSTESRASATSLPPSWPSSTRPRPSSGLLAILVG